MKPTLRPSNAEDFDFARKVHFLALRPHIEASTSWIDAEQDRFVERWFKPHRMQVIQVDGADAGVLVIESAPDRIFLESILLLPPYQGHGLGQAIMKPIIMESNERRVPIVLLVLKANPARRFYERLGFLQTFEDRTHFHMKRAPT